MKKLSEKAWIAGLGGTLMLAVSGLCLPAAAETFQAPPQTAASESAEQVGKEAGRAACREKIEHLREKWAALTDAQKAEVYALMEKQGQNGAALIDKLTELGLLDSDEAAKLKQQGQEHFNKLRDSGECPLMPPHRHSRNKEKNDG